MKKVLTLLTAIIVFANSFAATLVVSPNPPKKATEIFIPIGKNGEKISVLDFTEIRVKDYEKISGQQMTLGKKIGFKMMQREIKKTINPDGTIDKVKMEKAMKKAVAASEKSRKYLRLTLITLGLAIGLSLLGIAVPFLWILAYIAYLASGVFFILWLIEMANAS